MSVPQMPPMSKNTTNEVLYDCIVYVVLSINRDNKKSQKLMFEASRYNLKNIITRCLHFKLRYTNIQFYNYIEFIIVICGVVACGQRGNVLKMTC